MKHQPEETNTTKNNHYIQTETWAQTKQRRGWDIERLQLPGYPSTLFLYLKKVRGIGTLAYGPMWPNVFSDKDLKELKARLEQLAKKRNIFVFRFEPAVSESELDGKALKNQGFLQTEQHIQYLSTIVLDLTQAEDEIFKGFSGTGRNEARKAEKSGVVTEELKPTKENIQLFSDVVGQTKQRKNFYLRDDTFLHEYWQDYAKRGQGLLYAAKYEDEVLSMAYIVISGKKAFYKDAGSIYKKETAKLYGPTFMQWKIIQDLKRRGIESYDLCGALSHGKEDPSDPLWKVYRFKKKFSSELVTYPGIIDLPLQQRAYYRWLKAERLITKVHRKLTGEIWY